VAVSLLKPPPAVSESKRPLRNRFGSETTDKSVRSGVTVMQRPWPLAKVNGFILVWESFNWHYPSSPPQVLLRPGVHLERKGLIYNMQRALPELNGNKCPFDCSCSIIQYG
jgi:hypothetical protein